MKKMTLQFFLTQYWIFTFLLGLAELRDHDESNCNSYKLNELGCKCFTETTINNFACSNTINQLNCFFKENSHSNKTQNVNYYDYVIEDLIKNDEDNYCWSHFYFENVLKISSNSLANLKFSANRNQVNIFIWFRNVVEVDSFAFQNIRPYNDQSSIIRLQSGALLLRNKSFGNITRCKALELTSFVNIQSEIRTSLFSNSEIENLVISYINFKGFISDANTQLENIHIKNIIINSCFINIMNYQTIGKFYLLEGLQIKKSGLTLISGQVFENCCQNIQKLYLDDNLIKIIESEIFSGLTNLEYLNLEKNPITFIEKSAFDSVRKTLKKLNLKSTNLKSLEDSYFEMNSMLELTLEETHSLKLENVNIILKNSPNLRYLALSESNIVKTYPNLNFLLDEFEANLPNNSSFKYLDVSAFGVELDETIFNENFNQTKNCLWSKLLDQTFIKVDSNHQCNCALLYIYRNLTRFDFPFLNETALSYESDLSRPYLHDYFRIKIDTKEDSKVWQWKEIIQLLPKCYIQLLLESFDFNSITHLETKCGLWNENNKNCTEVSKTTFSPTSAIKNTTSEFLTTKTISSPYMLPVLVCLFVFSLVIIVLNVLKTRKKFSKKLQKNNHTMTGLPQLPKEMDNILTVSTIHHSKL